AIRERGVVVGDFAQAGAHDLTGGSRPFDRERREGILPFSVIRFFAVPPSQARMGAIPPRIRIATRESQLAMRQTSMVAAALVQRFPGLVVDIVGMTTKGDRVLDRPLAQVGGKGLFVRELEMAMTEGRADIAVHSLKD